MTNMTRRVKTRAAHVAVVGDGADCAQVVDGSVAESGTGAFESEDVGMGTIRSIITAATAWPMPGSFSQSGRRGTLPTCWIISQDPSRRSSDLRARRCSGRNHLPEPPDRPRPPDPLSAHSTVNCATARFRWEAGPVRQGVSMSPAPKTKAIAIKPMRSKVNDTTPSARPSIGRRPLSESPSCALR